jgi:thymidylate kinase
LEADGNLKEKSNLILYTLLALLSCIFLIVLPELAVKIILSLIVGIYLLKLAKIGIDLAFKPKVHKLSLKEIRQRVYKTMNIGNFSICLSGIDGAGKTTQAIYLLNFLREKGLKVKMVYGRWPAFTSYFILAIGKLLGLHKKEVEKSGIIRSIPNYRQLPVLARLYILLMLIDTFIFYLKVKIVSHANVIIFDRAAPDIIADLIYETGYYKLIKGESILSRIGSSLIQSMNVLIFFDLPVEVAYNRKPDAPLCELKFKRTVYSLLGQKYNIPIINADEPKYRIFQKIQKIFFSHLRKSFV